MLAKILRLTRSDAFWRYMDAFSPRIFALGLHTLVVWVFGAAQYGLAAWVAAAYGLVAAALPDPHSYITVRAHGARASRLSTLVSPVMWLKAMLCLAIAWGSAMVMTSTELRAAAGGQAMGVLAGAALYGASEFLWMYAGVAGFAADRTRRIAVIGLVSRCVGVVLSMTAYRFLHLELSWLMALYSLPTLVAVWVEFGPLARLSRVWCCYVQSLRQYTLWSQGIGLSSAVLAQLLPTGAGMLSSVSASEVGQIAYATRMLSGLVTPFQVLQMVLLKAYTRGGRLMTLEVLGLRKVFRWGAVGLMFAFGAAVEVAHLRGKMDVSSSIVMSLYGASAAVYTWYRFELVLRTAGKSIKEVFLKLYLPIMGVSLALSVPAALFLGVYGLALVSGLAWCALGVGAALQKVSATA